MVRFSIKPAKAVADPDHLHIEDALRRFTDGANGRVQSGQSPPEVKMPMCFVINVWNRGYCLKP